jgi:acyl-CoA thioester hydrolase
LAQAGGRAQDAQAGLPRAHIRDWRRTLSSIHCFSHLVVFAKLRGFAADSRLMSLDRKAPPAGFHWPVRVYFEDTDAGGVVYHATYLRFLERARTEWLRALGFEQDRLRAKQGVLFVVRRLTIDYVRPARFNDRLRVTTSLCGSGQASFDFAQAVLNDDHGGVCCRASVSVACVDVERMRPTRVPKEILNALSGALSGSVQPEVIDGI